MGSDFFFVLLQTERKKNVEIMIKALFFDVDGTLVSFNTHTIPPSTIEGIKIARKSGLKIFIATGRPKVIINNLHALQEADLIDGYITMNGSYCFVNDQVIYKQPIPTSDVEAMATFCREKGFPCIFITEHGISVCQPNELVHAIFYDFLHVDQLPVRSFEEAIQEPIYQMTPFFPQEEEAEICPLIPHCEMGRWFPAFTDVTAKGNTKQRGIDAIINHFGIRLEETMAFGDGGNDISMLRHAAIGVAMAGANDAVKAAANYVTAAVDEDGIWKAMQHFGILSGEENGKG